MVIMYGSFLLFYSPVPVHQKCFLTRSPFKSVFEVYECTRKLSMSLSLELVKNQNKDSHHQRNLFWLFGKWQIYNSKLWSIKGCVLIFVGCNVLKRVFRNVPPTVLLAVSQRTYEMAPSVRPLCDGTVRPSIM